MRIRTSIWSSPALGPPLAISRAATAPWTVSNVFLFEANHLLAHLRARSVKVGIATSVAQQYWAEAELYPAARNALLELTIGLAEQLRLFSDGAPFLRADGEGGV